MNIAYPFASLPMDFLFACMILHPEHTLYGKMCHLLILTKNGTNVCLSYFANHFLPIHTKRFP